MNRAVFLDRDGVIIELVLNPLSARYESAYRPHDVSFCPGSLEALAKLRERGFRLFVVSNQPAYAKGTARLEDLQLVHRKMHEIIAAKGITIQEYYYCYHHPDGVVPGYSGPCECRKPKPFFLLKAARDYGIDLKRSWLVGDRDTDIVCGKAAGVKTVFVKTLDKQSGGCMPAADAVAAGLGAAVESIIAEEE